MEAVHPSTTLVLALAAGVLAHLLARHLRVAAILVLLVAGASSAAPFAAVTTSSASARSPGAGPQVTHERIPGRRASCCATSP